MSRTAFDKKTTGTQVAETFRDQIRGKTGEHLFIGYCSLATVRCAYRQIGHQLPSPFEPFLLGDGPSPGSTPRPKAHAIVGQLCKGTATRFVDAQATSLSLPLPLNMQAGTDGIASIVPV